MNTGVKLGSYVLGLAVVFGGALGAGRLMGPAGPPPARDRATSAAPAHGGPAARQAVSDTPGGLQVSENGYTLVPLTAAVPPGEPTDFRFTVTGPGGRPVTGYQVRHDKKLHLIVASRDLDVFQHLHPALTPDGVWSVGLTLPAAGVYRVFADFAPIGGEAMTLGADLPAAGDYTPKPLPEATRTARVDGYTVTLDGDLIPGQVSRLTLTVAEDGEPVGDLAPYLGAYGHLVALRAGDLAYLHVHPDGTPGDGRTKAGPEVVFHAEVPGDGDYRLFLDFKHKGEVRTAGFTLGAGRPAAAPATPSAEPGPAESAESVEPAELGDHGH
ncbi:hypothetical protein [Sphaerisporangium dianthi]|uniref:Secreted protein n=1 Tax=Sphaerisporangium dianthi TaxID=1436120 RepID=A0ABV9CTT2_9ACTN